MSYKEKLQQLRNFYNEKKKSAQGDPREMRRFLILAFASVLFLDYLMFCYHAEKNIFDIFPAIPKFESSQSVTLFLPSPDGKTILKEVRKAGIYENKEKYAAVLFKMVLRGSQYENTSMAVPANFKIRRIWIEEGTGRCIIDVEPAVLEEGTVVVKGSEALFKKSLEQTLAANIPGIKKLHILERGVPDKSIWEM